MSVTLRASRETEATLRLLRDGSAVSSGRVTLEPDGSIDPAKADRSWVQNADPSKTRASPKLKPVPEAAVSLPRLL